MPRRNIWSVRQRAALFDLPTDEAALLRHYTLSDDDIEQIRLRRGAHNRLGFALQLCAFRYPGRILAAGRPFPRASFASLPHSLAWTSKTWMGMRYGRKHAGNTWPSSGASTATRCSRDVPPRDLKVWLEDEAEPARSNEGLARRFVEECRRRQVILPGPSVLERLCADALVAAERRIETRIAAGLDDAMRRQLDCLLTPGSFPRKWTAA